MMHTKIARRVLLAALASGLGACSTPQPLLDQANNGATLAMSLQTQLSVFRATQAEISQQRLDAISRQLASMATYQVESDFDDRIRRLAGSGNSQQLYSELRTLADSRGTAESALARQLADINADLAKVLEPLPDTAQSLAATQKTLAVLGEELSTKERAAAVKDFARTVKAAIDENRQKIDAARLATPIAPVQLAASAPSL
jgi:DNA repair exonuclease SbcCD ATPase subunit